jgi:hypothetical protein
MHKGIFRISGASPEPNKRNVSLKIVDKGSLPAYLNNEQEKRGITETSTRKLFDIKKKVNQQSSDIEKVIEQKHTEVERYRPLRVQKENKPATEVGKVLGDQDNVISDVASDYSRHSCKSFRSLKQHMRNRDLSVENPFNLNLPEIKENSRNV